MKRLISIILSMLIVVSAIGTLPALAEEKATSENFLDRVRSDFDLVWSDEFNGDTLDTTKWQFDGQLTRRNSEIQIYADSMEDGNLQFDGNNAIIVPKVETRVSLDGRKYKYTSAEISTQGKQSWKYGYFEVRAKASIGKNIVPAIWTMGYDYPSGTCDWPYSGEIDIIEGNSSKSVYSSLHHANSYGSKYHAVTGAGDQRFEHNLNEEFHNYWLFWTDKYLIIGVDDNMHQIVDITKPQLAQSFRTFEHWLILNVAMGMFASSVNDAEEDQWKMWIDYVRVYQLKKDEDYDKYIALSAKELIHNGSKLYENISPTNSNRALDLTIEQGKLSPGKYDVYAEVGNNTNGTETFINGQKTYDIAYVDHGKAVGNQAYIGSIDLQEDCSLDFTFKGKNNSSTSVKKLLFVKTNETKTNPIVANKNSCFQVSDYIEVSTEDELLEATKHIKENGTIKLLQDITLTKNVCIYNTCTIDLNGKTITSNNGKIQIYHTEKITTIKNGKIVIINDATTSFIYVSNNKYNVQVKIKNIDFQINTSKSGEIISHYYAGIVNSIDNCTFTFTDKVSNTNPFRITKNTAIYNNCTFHLNNKKVFLVTEGSSSQARQLYFNNCVVNDALYLFHSDNALTRYVEVKLANTTLNNLGTLTNHTENAQFVSVADNSVLKQNGETVDISADMTGDFTTECNHSFVDATCLLPKHCEYCNKEEGVALEHNIVTVTTPADCLYAGSVKTYCDKCSTVFSEKVLPVTEHNYQLVQTIEPTCKAAGYHLWTCSRCGMKQQRSYNGDGAVIKLPHNPDTSRTTVKEPTCTMGGYTQNYCLDCGSAYKTNLKRSIDHDCTETVDYEAGVIIYDCKDCDYTNTAPLDTCPHTPVENSGVVHEPTCKAQGYTEYTCNLCGKTYKDNYVDKLPSCVADTSKDKVVGATCDKEGYTEHTCTICSQIFKTDFTPATGNHTFDATKDKVVEPTCKEKGYTQRYCTVCKNTYKTDETAINPDVHNPQVSKAVESTCKENGLTEGSYCSWCNKILVAQEETPKKPHTEYVSRKGYESTCASAGYTDEISCSVCKTVIVERERLPMLEHTEVIDMPRKATCSQTGLTQGSHCSVCGVVLIEQVESPKKLHVESIDRGYAATCEKVGLTNGKHCSVCGEVTLAQEEIARLPHIVGSWETVSESERVKKCLVCNAVVESEKITAVCVHSTVIKNEKKATYFATGYTGDKVCGKCDNFLANGSVISKLTLKVPKFKLTKGKKQFKVKYTKVAGATGFQVRYKIKGKWKTKTFNTKKTATKVVKNLKKGNYQVQIRAMIVSGKQKAYSAWSKTQKVKVK